MGTQVDSDFNAITNSLGYIETYVIDLEKERERMKQHHRPSAHLRTHQRADALALDVMHIKAWAQSNLDPLNKQQIIEAIARICDDALAAYWEET